MTRKAIDIKGRLVEVPMTINQVYLWQYRAIIHAEIENGSALTAIELMVVLFGEDIEYWRSYKNVEEFINLSSLAYRIYGHITERTPRKSLSEINIAESVKPKKRRWWQKKRKSILVDDQTPANEIQVEDKKYYAPSDLLWQSAGQYMDALEVTSVIHDKTESKLIQVAWERLFKIYFYPIITGKEYSVEEAINMDIEKVRWYDVVDFGAFF
jgi:hypothetical protein